MAPAGDERGDADERPETHRAARVVLPGSVRNTEPRGAALEFGRLCGPGKRTTTGVSAYSGAKGWGISKKEARRILLLRRASSAGRS